MFRLIKQMFCMHYFHIVYRRPENKNTEYKAMELLVEANGVCAKCKKVSKNMIFDLTYDVQVGDIITVRLPKLSQIT